MSTKNEGVSINTTDLGNMERFIAQTENNFYFLKEKKECIYFDGKYWNTYKSDVILSHIIEKTILSIDKEINDAKDRTIRERLAKHAINSQSISRINAMVTLAKTRLTKELKEFDQNTMLLNVENGTIDLKTGNLLKHDETHYISKIVHTNYDPDAECPNWLEFLNLIMDNNAEMVTYLQRAVGYSLTGLTGERCIFILLGEGRNGKSTFTENISYLLNDYAMKTTAESLLVKSNGDGIPNDIARLKGARFVHASETASNRKLNEARIKEMAGDKDTLVARFLNCEFFEYIPNFKIFLHTNHKPQISGTDNAIWDRIRLIPFNVRIPDNKLRYREDIDNILKSEWSGMLSWAVQGCLHWRKYGLGNPDVISKATGQYRDESDPLKDFLEEVCNLYQLNTVTKGDLYKAYEQFSFKNGDRDHLRMKDFNKQIKARGFDDDRESTGDRKMIWKGIGINNDNYNKLKVV